MTPGTNNGAYNVAAQRGRGDSAGPPAAPAASAAAQAAVPPRAASGSGAVPINPARQPFVPRTMNAGTLEDTGPPPPLPQVGAGRDTRPSVLAPPQAPGPATYSSGAEQEDSGAENVVGNGPNTILDRIFEEEDELIQCHRKDIEETMNTVRSEMNLLAEVDSPGSEINTYVVKLKEILEKKERAIAALWAKLTSFERQLQEEEYARSMAPSR